MSADQQPTAGRRWVTPVTYGVLGLELAVVALAYSCALILKLAGYRPSRIMVAGLVAAAMALDPMYETLFLGQINLILLALILTDIWRVSRGHDAGIGVGIAAAIKLTPAIFIVFFLLARLLTLVANCFLIAGLAFGAYMAACAYRSRRPAPPGRSQGQTEDLGAPGRGAVRAGPG